MLHARSDFEDGPELHRRRHLLRMWIDAPGAFPVDAAHALGDLLAPLPARWRDASRVRPVARRGSANPMAPPRQDGAMSLPIVILIVLLVLLGALAVAVAFRAGRSTAGSDAEAHRSDRDAEREADAAAMQAAIDAAVQRAVVEARHHATAERDASVKAALEQSALLQREQFDATMERQQAQLTTTTTQVREQLDTTTAHVKAQLDTASAQLKEQTSADLGAKKDVIEARLDQVHDEMRAELAKVTEMLSSLGRSSARTFGEVESSLKAHMEIASTLSESTQALRSALANPQARGQWGERMAEDVLRLAGFVENVNYVKQTQIEGGSGRPDYTFRMPKGQTLFMDVKFPMASYLRHLEAGTDAERETHLKRFLGDVRARVRELAKREYAVEGGGSALDNVLLFIPNEQLTGFIHEHDPALIEDAMGQQIVMCSPLTLFAFLGVIRQAHDNFMIEQTSDEILQLIGRFGTQWTKYAEQVDKTKRSFERVERDFEALAGTRRKMLERPLRDLEAIRQQRGLPVDGELFSLEPGDDDETPPDGNLRRLA
ncbi:DNA recombination protein RmuC [Ilumatobacter sp.]|uniref:DNA recombination protein RmuC n=1 Tax=Ilumatobacter sp. TaxID=1967498 RepID=UPI003B523BA6